MPREQSMTEQHNDKLPPSEAITCAGINFQLIEGGKGAYKENDDGGDYVDGLRNND